MADYSEFAHAQPNLRVPSSATELVRTLREEAEIPYCVNDITLFVAIASNQIGALHREHQADALRYYLGLGHITAIMEA